MDPTINNRLHPLTSVRQRATAVPGQRSTQRRDGKFAYTPSHPARCLYRNGFLHFLASHVHCASIRLPVSSIATMAHPPFEDNAPKIVGTVATLVVLGSIVLPLRIHVRASNRALGRDDWAMIAAVVCA
jgi:hypothetical protein